MTLQDEARNPLGTIHIFSAEKGNVTRVEGMYQGRNMEQFEEDSEPGRHGRGRLRRTIRRTTYVKRHAKRLYRKTKEDARRIFLKTKRSFKDFVARW